jgi:Predicted nucleoside-diphosphate sugar epimerase
VHLAGAGVADHRWTARYKAEIRASRVLGTRTLAGALAKLSPPPATLVAASAIGWYGDTGGREVDESAPSGPPSSRAWSGTGRRPPSLPPTPASGLCTPAAA